MATNGDADDVEELLDDVDDNRPSALSHPVRPALEVLQLDQRELINADDERLEERPTPAWDLRSGFPGRREAVEWYQRAAIRTLGRFADDDHVPPRALIRDRSLLQILIVGDERTHYVSAGDDPIPLDEASERRRALEERHLLPATTRAYNDLRGAAGEYIEVFEDNSDRDPVDFTPESQANLAMRPAFSRLDRLQQIMLDRLWGGFEDHDALRDWLHDLNRAANGQVDPELSERTMTDTTAVACLTGGADDTHARREREKFAIVEILPAFVEAVESMETGELAKRRKTNAQTFQF